MGRLLQSRTPAQLIRIIAIANVFLVSSYTMLLIQAWRLPKGQHLSSRTTLIWGVIAIPAIIGSMLAESALRKGVAGDQWPEALLVAPRKLMEHPAIPVLKVLLFVAGCAAIVSPLGSAISNFWLFLFPLQNISSVGRDLRKPVEANDSGGLTLLHLQAHSNQKHTAPEPLR